MSAWRRVPTLVRAVLTGSLIATIGTVPWALLASLNLRHGSAVPWAVLPAALHLWLFWRYFGGAGPPRSTAALRQAGMRAHRLSDEVWGAALIAGGVGLVALLLFQQVMARLVVLPQQRMPDVSHVPAATLFLILLAGAAVAGIVEETAFRGYMQGPIERRHGPAIAILATGAVFALVHFTHPEVTFVLLPYYLGAAAVYGMLAYLTKSILPSMVLHAGGNAFVGFDLLARGQSEWQASPAPAPLVWTSGADGSFWIALVAFLVMAAVTVGAYVSLAGVAGRQPSPPSDRPIERISWS